MPELRSSPDRGRPSFHRIVQTAVKHVPSSFNTQSTRAVVFFHDASVKAWDTIAEEFLKNIVSKLSGSLVSNCPLTSARLRYPAIDSPRTRRLPTSRNSIASRLAMAALPSLRIRLYIVPPLYGTRRLPIVLSRGF